MQEKTLKNVLNILIIIFIFSLIPLYYIGTYAHPSADDFSYGIRTARTWNETHSLTEVLSVAATKTVDKYNTWQGNFSALFLMHLQPAIFGEEFYILTPFLLLTSFILCSLFFYYTGFRKLLKGDPILAWIGSILIVLFALQFTHVPSDSFYWYNGAIYYTFFNSLTLLLYGIIIRLYYEKKTWQRWVYFIFAFPLSFIIGGSNYSTALLNGILLAFILLYSFYRKKEIWKYYLPLFLIGLIALFVSISGPGNMLRQATIGKPHGVITSILLSFVYGGYTVANATTVPLLLFWCLLIPIFWKILDRNTFSFEHPFLFICLSFCIYSAQITPVIFAQGIRIPYRIMNIVYFNYFPFIGINLFYLLGFLKRRHKIPSMAKPFSVPHYYMAIFLGILIFTLGSIRVSESDNGNVVLSNLPFTPSAVYSLVTGEAKTFDLESKERIAYMKATKGSNIVLEPLTKHPYVLFHSDITENSYHWKNRHYAEFYGKRTARISDEN